MKHKLWTAVLSGGSGATLTAGGTVTVYGTLKGTDTSSKLVVGSEASVTNVTGVATGNSYTWNGTSWEVNSSLD